jgi:hypothetical protein
MQWLNSKIWCLICRLPAEQQTLILSVLDPRCKTSSIGDRGMTLLPEIGWGKPPVATWFVEHHECERALGEEHSESKQLAIL